MEKPILNYDFNNIKKEMTSHENYTSTSSTNRHADIFKKCRRIIPEIHYKLIHHNQVGFIIDIQD